MELSLQRQPITINEVLYDGFTEHAIECDALLPDYCPDIVKVLKCAVTTAVGSTTVNGDRLTIEGMAFAHVYYASEKGNIRHTEYKIPFAKSVDMRAAPADPITTVMPSVDYVNCRAVNQRRLDIRGAVTFKIKVVDQKQEQVISDASGGHLQLRRDMIHVTEMSGQSESSFNVSEELEVGYGKPPVGSIIRTDCRVSVQDYKVIAGKIVCKGDFMLHVCYQPVDNEKNLEIMEYTLPLSQIIDSDGADDNCLCDVEMFVTGCDVTPKLSENGEYHMLGLDAMVKAVVGVYRHKEVPVASDCYSTKYDCSCKHKRVNFMRLAGILHENVMHKAELDLPEGVKNVLDAWCEVDNLGWKYDKNELKITLRLTVSMFANMEDGEALYFEQSEDMEKTVHVPGTDNTVYFDPTADILSCAYNLAGTEKIDIRCEVIVKGCVHCPVTSNSISEISVDETKPKTKEKNKLFIYYADQGESIWNIAKQYNTSANAIWEENSVEDDILPGKTMLMIPII